MVKQRLLVTILAAVMILSLVAIPGMAAAETDAEPTFSAAEDEPDDGENASDGDDDGEDSDVNESDSSNESDATDGFSIDVDQNGEIVVTVTDNGTGVDSASVEVSTVDENASYADNGTYTTDENGTVALDAPTGNESVEVAFKAVVDDETVDTTTKTLEPVDEESETDGENFGSIVSAFVEETKDNESDEPLGIQVAGFVVENNPGNAPAHAGPPGHAGPPSNDSEKGSQGPPEHAGGNDDDDSQGPPEHAGGSPPGQSDE